MRCQNRITLIHTAVSCAILCAIVLTASCKPPRGEDSWAHYRSGGNFVSGPLSFGVDCRTLYFSSPATGQGDIYSVDLKTGAKRRLTSSPKCDLSPYFLPKSDRLLFTREFNGRRHVWSMAPDGSDQQQITSGDFLDDLAAVSSNEKHLLILRSPFSLGLGRLVSLCVLSLDLPEVEPRQVGSRASFSPSGDEIVFNPVDALQEIWIWNLNDDTKSQVGSGTSPMMSPDGQSILAIEVPEGGGRQHNYDIVLIDVASGKKQVLAQGGPPRFVPDGSGIMFKVTHEDYSRDLVFVNVDGNQRVKVELPSRQPTTLPAFCPDGSKCVIATLPTGPHGNSRPVPHKAYLIDTNDWSHQVVDLTIPVE